MLRVTTLALLGLVVVMPTDRAAAQVRNPATELVVPSVGNLSPDRVDRTYEPDELISLSAAGISRTIDALSPELRAPQSYAEAVENLDIKPYLLFPPTDNAARLSTNRVPREVAHTRLSLEGTDYALYVADVIYDSRYKLRHVTAAIVNQADAYARFTVDDQRGILVGTLHTSDRDYRILPITTGGQIAYRLRQPVDNTDTPRRYLPVARKSVHNDDTIQIESRHRQAELLADIQPTYARTERETFNVVLDGGELGLIDVEKIDAEAIKKVLVRLGPMTRVQGNEAFEVTRVLGGDDSDYSIFYRQVIEGVPVALEKELRVSQSGRITSITSGLIAPDYTKILPAIDDTRAVNLAVDAAIQQRQLQETVPTVISKEVTYRVNTKERSLEPYWLIALLSFA